MSGKARLLAAVVFLIGFYLLASALLEWLDR